MKNYAQVTLHGEISVFKSNRVDGENPGPVR